MSYIRINSTNNLSNFNKSYDLDAIKKSKNPQYIFTNESYGLPVLAEALYIAPQKDSLGLDSVSAEIGHQNYDSDTATSCPKIDRTGKLEKFLGNSAAKYNKEISEFDDIKTIVVGIVTKSSSLNKLDQSELDLKFNSSGNNFKSASTQLLLIAHYLGQGNLPMAYSTINVLNGIIEGYKKNNSPSATNSIESIVRAEQESELQETFKLINSFIAEQEQRIEIIKKKKQEYEEKKINRNREKLNLAQKLKNLKRNNKAVSENYTTKMKEYEKLQNTSNSTLKAFTERQELFEAQKSAMQNQLNREKANLNKNLLKLQTEISNSKIKANQLKKEIDEIEKKNINKTKNKIKEIENKINQLNKSSNNLSPGNQKILNLQNNSTEKMYLKGITL